MTKDRIATIIVQFAVAAVLVFAIMLILHVITLA